MRVIVTLGLVPFMWLGASVPAQADSDSDSACGVQLLGLQHNCAQIRVEVDIVDSSCHPTNNISYYRCRVNETVTASATAWLNPGSMTTSVSGDCVASRTDSWNLGGVLPYTLCSSYDRDFQRGVNVTLAVNVVATFTGVGAPRTLRASASDSYTAPLPPGPAVRLYRHANYSPCSGNFDDGMWNLNGYHDECHTDSMNDNVSSFATREDCSITIYQHINRGGALRTFARGTAVPNLATFNYTTDPTRGMNDDASSIEVVCVF